MHGTLQSAIDAADVPLLLKLDVANAFSSLSRTKLTECLTTACAGSSLAPWSASSPLT